MGDLRGLRSLFCERGCESGVSLLDPCWIHERQNVIFSSGQEGVKFSIIGASFRNGLREELRALSLTAFRIGVR